jgi:hypothetical protein
LDNVDVESWKSIWERAMNVLPLVVYMQLVRKPAPNVIEMPHVVLHAAGSVE